MIIVPTRQCNTNRCNYCGVYKKNPSENYFKNFPIEKFYDNISHLSEISNDFNLRFFGGEPFLSFPVIKEIITYFSLRSNKFNFIINTNLTILSKDILSFLKEYNVKLIISCNGNIESHTLSRGISVLETLSLYKNIKKVIEKGIIYQLNIVTQNETVDDLYSNFKFLFNELGLKSFNLLPVSYNGWNINAVHKFKEELSKIEKDIRNGELEISFINKDVNNEVGLFNSEIIIDVDGKIYPSMVIMETFFNEEKSKILISDIKKDLLELKKDFMYWQNDLHKIYSAYINKVLDEKFSSIVENDSLVSKIFGDFLKKI